MVAQWLAPVAGAISGAAGLAGTLFGMTQGQPGISSEEAAYRDWTRTIEPTGLAINRLFYNPAFEGQLFPFAAKYNLPTGANRTRWAPTQSTKRLYSNYLNRQWGLPTRIASKLSTQAMMPSRYEGGLQGKYNPAGARQAYSIQPQTLAQSRISQQEPEALRQFDYLKGAAQLAQYNLWRLQQLPRLIG